MLNYTSRVYVSFGELQAFIIDEDRAFDVEGPIFNIQRCDFNIQIDESLRMGKQKAWMAREEAVLTVSWRITVLPLIRNTFTRI